MAYDGEVKWLPVRAVANSLGVSAARIYQLIESGALTSVKVDSTVLVSMRSVELRRLDRERGGKRAA